MPRNRRNSSTNFDFAAEFLRALPPPDKVNDCILREPLESKKCDSSSSDNISDIVSFGRSSASSLSWNDDFESEGTQRVKNELERLDRILQGKESIPAHYNKGEYEQWMRLFPGLSVFEKHTNSLQKRQVTANLKEKLSKRFDSLLRISPVMLQTSKRSYLDQQVTPNNLVLKSAKTSAKWIREEERRTNQSLPYISAKRFKNVSKASSSSNKKSIVLPPIKVGVNLSSGQFRSISATPRKVYNEQSVVSAHIETLKRRRKATQEFDSVRHIFNAKS